ncbi:MAG: S8 family serine peptidase [Sphingobacteriales bacterium]|nr:S8 family serine peptidase [Sphingobacteriales bacterium]
MVVAAAGNDNVSDPMYPASYNHVINVAAIDDTDTKASFTNYGETIDVSAPGVQIWSSVATSTNSYEFYDGTSMACPFVSGLCALMLSFDPNATVDRVEQCLKETADDIYTINPTFVGQLGAGRINAFEAVKCIPSEPVAAFAASAAPPCASEVVTFFDNSAGTDLTSWQWTFQNGTPATSTQQNPTVSFPSSGSYNVTLTVTNN